MSNYQLPVIETIQTSWRKIFGFKATFWGAIGVIILISIAFGITQGIFISLMGKAAGGIVGTIGQIIGSILNFGLLYMGIQRGMDLAVNYKQVFYAFKFNIILNVILFNILMFLIFLPLTLLMVLCAFLYTKSTILAIILGILTVLLMVFIGVRLMLSMGFILQRQSGALDAIKLSYKATEGNVLRLIAIAFLQTLIVIVCALPLLIGLIWAIPFALTNYGVMYSRLSKQV